MGSEASLVLLLWLTLGWSSLRPKAGRCFPSFEVRGLGPVAGVVNVPVMSVCLVFAQYIPFCLLIHKVWFCKRSILGSDFCQFAC